MKKVLSVFTICLILIFNACSKKTSPGKTAEAPKVKATTYADLQPLMQAKCTPCHFPSKGGNKASFETYASAKDHGPDMLTRVQLNPGDRGFMPFKHAKLADDEIAQIRKWVNDGMQEK